ncbi:hypothetical protein NEHOM01_2413 [Nematocida homosporus]|uniref:uncharacterized protein n=1 Tax=Nematocida homosporus TaxID=1912981 RepID=UPI00222062D0|nr:uncharacterized protein NEHOM01_2413 [Nematocida homosporus]KAI5187858.1 hypothetical protein NEHOM01_2413 [Nematocida homosporus]
MKGKKDEIEIEMTPMFSNKSGHEAVNLTSEPSEEDSETKRASNTTSIDVQSYIEALLGVFLVAFLLWIVGPLIHASLFSQSYHNQIKRFPSDRMVMNKLHEMIPFRPIMWNIGSWLVLALSGANLFFFYYNSIARTLKPLTPRSCMGLAFFGFILIVGLEGLLYAFCKTYLTRAFLHWFRSSPFICYGLATLVSIGTYLILWASLRISALNTARGSKMITMVGLPLLHLLLAVIVSGLIAGFASILVRFGQDISFDVSTLTTSTQLPSSTATTVADIIVI